MPAERPAQSVAVELFQELGMSQYEAANYVALLQFGEATLAQSVRRRTSRNPGTIPSSASKSGVGRRPARLTKVFRPVARETALRHFRNEYDSTFSRLADRLAALEPIDAQHEQSEVWTTTSRAAVDDRVSGFLQRLLTRSSI